MSKRLRPSAPRASLFPLLLAISFVLPLAGCAEPTSKVNGVVTLDGRPLHWGTVSFYDNNGGIHRAEIDAKGRYEISGLPAGAAKVSVVSMKAYLRTGDAKPVATLQGMEQGSPEMLSEGTITEDKLRSMFGATREEQQAQNPGQIPKQPGVSPAPKEDDLSHIPLRYADITSSGLTCTLEAPQQVYNINLTKAP